MAEKVGIKGEKGKKFDRPGYEFPGTQKMLMTKKERIKR